MFVIPVRIDKYSAQKALASFLAKRGVEGMPGCLSKCHNAVRELARSSLRARLKLAYSLLHPFDLGPLDLQECAAIKPIFSLAESAFTYVNWYLCIDAGLN